ncbi:hypothetical protein O7632_10715 [Solwaraspora sp. WMMD406]|uniref:aa3-type cytochrome oxidase subunit CtaJ n=1 Tax=Solwaraspora sp. WMMD406 TaxID=3016095 RepID=UPI002417E5EA|nr:hypothetical protein [Solwaraspora sp. WMMD406]MDG4764570.1 hypothetical protein [Solwaraspora sp. WMMD406]
MTVTSTLLYFVVIPAVIVLVVTGLSMIGGRGGTDRRYRPGRSFEFSPVWYVSAGHPAQGTRAAELPSGSEPAAIGGSGTVAAQTGVGRTRPGATGGASDRW